MYRSADRPPLWIAGNINPLINTNKVSGGFENGRQCALLCFKRGQMQAGRGENQTARRYRK